jgi:hypothetical protein
MFEFPTSGSGSEPARDERLGALLRDAVGDPQLSETEWHTLAERVGAAVRAQQPTPWWGHVARWQLRALPLALAAGLMGAFALWNAAQSPRETAAPYYAGDAITAVVSGTSSAEAARSYAGFVTNTVDYSANVPE